ncbi:CheY-like chemotaxis protein [Sphingomonas xinjiangensis]|uniref:CheY-like chemotaxis protein n=1 Tax=Sphingomonas xinjiangensis TaxID=643568 RepID=A0A840YT77_9SPHN|nr:response regulator [Sphingomonas xinjiangensis]MBB5712884.1 CheY-like chemotaxis protein [Sphingomonas xinjiangensis]
MIIEDEPMVAMFIEEALELAGASSFDIAATEADAVAFAAKHRPEVITSDVRLVEGTGPRAVKQIHDQLGDIPVIFITGTPFECDEQNMSPVLMKPVTLNAVMEAFEKVAPEGDGCSN